MLQNSYNQQLSQFTLCEDSNQYNQTWDAATVLRNTIASSLMPWHDFGPTTTKETALELSKAYVDEFGDPNDPTVEAEIDRAVAWLKGDSNG